MKNEISKIMDFKKSQISETQKETKNYIRKHGLSFSDFTSDIGIKSVYTGQQVLDWLGY